MVSGAFEALFGAAGHIDPNWVRQESSGQMREQAFKAVFCAYLLPITAQSATPTKLVVSAD